ncbi:MAG TPA: O-antigen ligase family protein [Thermoleophilaceae bacterium]|nr:O-antigen ligase family protein [Thermoleophilaceae bacterium]
MAAAVLAAAAVLLDRPRPRAAAMAGALVLTPVLLIAEIWDTDQFATFRDRPALTAVAGAVALLALAVLAFLMSRRPLLLPVLVFAALPFRVPIEAAGLTANLLVPLYGVIAAGTLAQLPALAAGRAPAGSRARPSGPLAAVLLAFVVVYAVQAIYADDVGPAAQQIVFFYVPFALLFGLLLRIEWTRRLLVWCLGVALALALVFALIGFVEYATRTLLLNPKVIASNAFGSYFRVNSLFFDPNIYGRFLAEVMIAVAAVVAWTTRRRDIYLFAAALAVLWAALVLTFSQSSFAALLAGLAVVAALRWNLRPVALIVAAIVAVGAIGGAAALAVRGDIPSPGEVDDATVGRSKLVSGGLDLWADRPVQGFGSGSFQYEYRRKRDLSRPNAVTASHTTPITVVAEQGLIGLVLYVALIAVALTTLISRARGSLPRVAIAAAFTALIVHTMVYAAFLEDPLAWVLLAAGAVLAAGQSSSAVSSSSSAT